MCPAAIGKIRCPLRPKSMAPRPRASRGSQRHQSIRPRAVCQQTITVRGLDSTPRRRKSMTIPPRHIARAYARRRRQSAPTRPSRIPPPLTSPGAGAVSWGWRPSPCSSACAFVVRNLRVLDAFEERQRENERREAAGLPPRTRRRRRQEHRRPHRCDLSQRAAVIDRVPWNSGNPRARSRSDTYGRPRMTISVGVTVNRCHTQR